MHRLLEKLNTARVGRSGTARPGGRRAGCEGRWRPGQRGGRGVRPARVKPAPLQTKRQETQDPTAGGASVDRRAEAASRGARSLLRFTPGPRPVWRESRAPRTKWPSVSRKRGGRGGSARTQLGVLQWALETRAAGTSVTSRDRDARAGTLGRAPRNSGGAASKAWSQWLLLLANQDPWGL